MAGIVTDPPGPHLHDHQVRHELRRTKMQLPEQELEVTADAVGRVEPTDVFEEIPPMEGALVPERHTHRDKPSEVSPRAADSYGPAARRSRPR